MSADRRPESAGDDLGRFGRASELAVIGPFARGPRDHPLPVTSRADLDALVGRPVDGAEEPYDAARLCLDNGGRRVWIVRSRSSAPEDLLGDAGSRTGLHALDLTPDRPPTLVCLPAAARLPAPALVEVVRGAAAFARTRRLFVLVDLPPGLTDAAALADWRRLDDLRDANAACWHPSLSSVGAGGGRRLPTSGAVAGLLARRDDALGLWASPSGRDATIVGGRVRPPVDDAEAAALRLLGVNPIQERDGLGTVSAGARTLAAADGALTPEGDVAARRLALYVAESLRRSLDWTASTTVSAGLWRRVRDHARAELAALFRAGAFAGGSPRDAFTVALDPGGGAPAEATATARARGGVQQAALVVGFAPLRPREFVILSVPFEVWTPPTGRRGGTARQRP